MAAIGNFVSATIWFIRGEGLIPRGLPQGIKPESNTSREQHTPWLAVGLLISL
jgi:hypothetical protein